MGIRSGRWRGRSCRLLLNFEHCNSACRVCKQPTSQPEGPISSEIHIQRRTEKEQQSRDCSKAPGLSSHPPLTPPPASFPPNAPDQPAPSLACVQNKPGHASGGTQARTRLLLSSSLPPTNSNTHTYIYAQRARTRTRKGQTDEPLGASPTACRAGGGVMGAAGAAGVTTALVGE